MLNRFSRLSVILSAGLLIVVGLTTLIGLLLGNVTLATEIFQTVLPDFPAVVTLPTGNAALVFVNVAVVTIAMTILIGVINLVYVNGRRIIWGRTMSARAASLVILISFIGALGAYLLGETETFQMLLEDVQVPIESALASLLFFALVYGGFRILRRQISVARILFVISMLIVLIGALPIMQSMTLADQSLVDVTDWMLNVPVLAGTSGILIGIALATVVTGLRILIGQDRTYGE